VTLFAGSASGASELGHTTTDTSGAFAITYTRPGSAGLLYVDARQPGASRLRLRAVVGVGAAGDVPPHALSSATVDELTTVAAGYALAQFSGRSVVRGPAPGLQNAAATTFNLADSASGKPGAIVTDVNNGPHNNTLAMLGTLANLVSSCASAATSTTCAEFLRLAAPRDGVAPGDTLQGIVDLARNPTLATTPLYALAKRLHVYGPSLTAAPTAWILVLRYTDSQLYASGRIGIDAKGNIWSSNNWLPGTHNPSPFLSVLSPVGAPVFGSPIEGGGMKGGAWGMAIGPQGVVWAPSFGGDAMSQYSAEGEPISPNTGWTEGSLDHPQGDAIDQRGNVWIANNYGPESAPGQGSVVVYPGGNPAKAVTIRGGGLNHPFAIQIDGYGRAWVTNAGLGGSKLVGTKAAILVGKFGGSVTVINPDFKPAATSPIQDSSFKWPLGLAIDSQNNAWTANYFSSSVTRLRPNGTVAASYKLPRGTLPWSEAIDGADRVWVAGFGTPHVWLLCGVNLSACPPGASTGEIVSPHSGFQSAAIQHVTSVQLDQSGNVWLSNNWSQLVPPVGGVGVAEMIGVATPVCTPLQPLPTRPVDRGTPCPKQTAAPLPASFAPRESPGSEDPSAWIAAVLGVAILALMAAAAILIARRRSEPLPQPERTAPPTTTRPNHEAAEVTSHPSPPEESHSPS
jgi:hypothetical protein